jgi:hypothetical protein
MIISNDQLPLTDSQQRKFSVEPVRGNDDEASQESRPRDLRTRAAVLLKKVQWSLEVGMAGMRNSLRDGAEWFREKDMLPGTTTAAVVGVAILGAVAGFWLSTLWRGTADTAQFASHQLSWQTTAGPEVAETGEPSGAAELLATESSESAADISLPLTDDGADKDVELVQAWLSAQQKGRTGFEYWSTEDSVRPARFLALRSWEIVDDYVENGARQFTVRADSSTPTGAWITKLWTVTVHGFYTDPEARKYDPRITQVQETIKVEGVTGHANAASNLTETQM